MISLALLAAFAAGAANIALVTLMADRLGPKAGTAVSAGEFAAVGGAASASRKAGAVRVGNENRSPLAAKRAA